MVKKIVLISDYLELHKKHIQTEEYEYISYTFPNTMYQVNNNIDELLLSMPSYCMIMWHRCLSLLKRSPDSIRACSLVLTADKFADVLSRNYYYKAKKLLLSKALLYATSDKDVYVVNIQYANKLYKPKIDIE